MEMVVHGSFLCLLISACISCDFSLEMLDKVEPPTIPEGYAMSVAFHCLLDLVRGITTMIEGELGEVETESPTVTEGASSQSSERRDEQSASDHMDQETGVFLVIVTFQELEL